MLYTHSSACHVELFFLKHRASLHASCRHGTVGGEVRVTTRLYTIGFHVKKHKTINAFYTDQLGCSAWHTIIVTIFIGLNATHIIPQRKMSHLRIQGSLLLCVCRFMIALPSHLDVVAHPTGRGHCSSFNLINQPSNHGCTIIITTIIHLWFHQHDSVSSQDHLTRGDFTFEAQHPSLSTWPSTTTTTTSSTSTSLSFPHVHCDVQCSDNNYLMLTSSTLALSIVGNVAGRSSAMPYSPSTTVWHSLSRVILASPDHP